MSAPTFEAVMEWRNLDHNAAQVRADSRHDLIIDGLGPDRQLNGRQLLVPGAAEPGRTAGSRARPQAGRARSPPGRVGAEPGGGAAPPRSRRCAAAAVR